MNKLLGLLDLTVIGLTNRLSHQSTTPPISSGNDELRHSRCTSEPPMMRDWAFI